MLLLSVDTSGKNGSIALARGEFDGGCEVFDVVALEGGTFSAQLVPQISALLANDSCGEDPMIRMQLIAGTGEPLGALNAGDVYTVPAWSINALYSRIRPQGLVSTTLFGLFLASLRSAASLFHWLCRRFPSPSPECSIS